MSADRENGSEQKPLTLKGDRPQTRWARARNELVSFGDTDLAILGAGAAGLLGIFQITDLETTVALTLAVLAAVAFSQHRDRTLREKLKASVDELDGQLSRVSRAYSNPLPYDVIDACYRWTFDDAGRVAKVEKRARVRFVHNGVWTILAWHTDKVRAPAAHLCLDEDKIHPLSLVGKLDMGDGKYANVIALDRKYGQNQILNYEYRFESHNNYPNDREWINIAIETFTANLTVEIVWPSNRLPSIVWLDEESKSDPGVVERGDEHVTNIERENIDAGKSISIRWLWDPARKAPAKKAQESNR